jgi:RimJ/RimL family protein N-acetyltransferase
MIYRSATLDDITPRGIALVDEAMRETSWGDEDVCPVRSLYTLTSLISDPRHLVAVAEEGDELVGVVIATIEPSMFSANTHAAMHVWYVRPKYRGSRAAYRLARVYRDWARLMGVRTAYFDVNSLVNNDLAGRIAEKLGFSHIGNSYKALF